MLQYPWLLLLVAGLLEGGWALGLKLSDGLQLQRPVLSALTVLAIAASMWLLGMATREIPIGTAYAVWVGIGVIGAAVGGALWLGEPMTWQRAAFLVLLVVALVGLKLTSATQPA